MYPKEMTKDQMLLALKYVDKKFDGKKPVTKDKTVEIIGEAMFKAWSKPKK